MKLILHYIRPYRWYILAVMLIKLLGTGTDLLMPYVLEHLLDHVIPAAADAWPVIFWGCVMLLLTLVTRVLNVCANRMSVRVARNSTFALRRDLFHTALNLSGNQMDKVGLPSLISRMTSDSYNVQSFVRMIQTMGIRSPIMLVGGIIITLTMDTGLAAILCVMAPIMIVLVCFVSWKGIPLYNEVQRRMDVLVRRMRESITGIRVVKALGKEPYEEHRYGEANASANRIGEVVDLPEDLTALPAEDLARAPSGDALVFDHVSFNYDADDPAEVRGQFLGEQRQQCLKDISFRVKKGGSLGIIGATGSGKTTVVNLLMRFYDPQAGHVFVDGKDVRGYDKDELHRKFGVVFQNDVIFADTIRENITFGRETDGEKLVRAAEDAMAKGFIDGYMDSFDHEAAIRGANFSGGQKQRLLIARALAADPEILILDDASSALDYRTDAELRKALRAHHSDATTVVIAQRISSVMSLDEIIVLHEGEMISRGTHEELLASCPEYRDICRIQLSETEVG